MKKSHIIIILILSILLIAGGIYYFYFYPAEETAQIIQERDTETVQKREEDEGRGEISENPTEKAPVTVDVPVEEIVEEEMKTPQVEVLTTAQSYRRTFRNPFRDFRSSRLPDGMTIEMIKSMVPFELKGIIGNNYGRLAVINYRNETRIIRHKTEIEGFWIIDIQENELVIVYEGVQFKLEMESGMNEGF